MGLFDFGSNKSSSQGSSLDISVGRSGSVAGSSDIATSRGVSGGSSSQSIFAGGIFESLFSEASRRAGEAISPAKQLFSGGLNFLDALQGNVGTDALAKRITGPNEALQANLGALQESLGRLFREELNPAIAGEAVSGGTLGGGRQGVAQGAAARGIAEQFTQGAASLIGQDQEQRDEAAATLGTLLQEGAGLGLDSLPGLLAVGLEGEANLAPLEALSRILGGPTVLTEASDFSRSFSDSIGESFQESFGENFSFGTSQQTSKSSGFSFGLF